VTPQRIQLHRKAGWRKPDNAIVVARPSRWGNPFSAMAVARSFPSLTDEQVHMMLVAQFRDLVRRPAQAPLRLRERQADGSFPVVTYTYPSLDEIRAELAGKDLACWCPPELACHADVLLEIANAAPVANVVMPPEVLEPATVVMPERYVVEFDYRSDGGPRLVGTFGERAGAYAWLATVGADYEANVGPIAITDDAETFGPCTDCGRAQTRNPHPHAGEPGHPEASYAWICVPCLVENRHRWAERAMRAESELTRLTRETP
jgi:hypothetical protein